MKKLLISLLTIYSINCYAQTESLNWYIDGTIYDTTTCESGNDIILPPTPPERYGYTFTGWQEIFNRGTFANWASVPTATSGYSKDVYNSRTPKENDYIIVTNTSDFGNTAYLGSDGTTLYWNIEGVRGSSLIANIPSYERSVGEYGTVGFRNDGGHILYLYVYKANYYKSSPSSSSYLSTGYAGAFNPATSAGTKIMYTNPIGYSGTWRFRYSGNWLTDGKSGWVPEKRLD